MNEFQINRSASYMFAAVQRSSVDVWIGGKLQQHAGSLPVLSRWGR